MIILELDGRILKIAAAKSPAIGTISTKLRPFVFKIATSKTIKIFDIFCKYIKIDTGTYNLSKHFLTPSLILSTLYLLSSLVVFKQLLLLFDNNNLSCS